MPSTWGFCCMNQAIDTGSVVSVSRMNETKLDASSPPIQDVAAAQSALRAG
jgi:hypothetical protein